MTSLAIIGGGIAGRSLLFHLAKSGIPFQKITLFTSEKFARPCSLNSTAIVAKRGVSTGLSDLGDILSESFDLFEDHFQKDAPDGVMKVIQYTGASSNIDQFKKRYPNGEVGKKLGPLGVSQEFYHASEEAYMIDPATYLDWLLSSSESLPLEIEEDFVKSVNPGEKILVETLGGLKEEFDKLIFAGGVYNQHWKEILAPEKDSLSKTVPGSYLEFTDLKLDIPSLSLTLDGDNFIYDAQKKRLLIGSTTEKVEHELSSRSEVKSIYQRLRESLELELPDFDRALIRTGLREKASKREPYLIQKHNIFALGGFYKNGFSINLKLSQDILKRL